MLSNFGYAVELVLRHIFRQPVAAVIGEVELVVHRIPVEAHGVAYAPGNGLSTRTVKIDAADLTMRGTMQQVVARLAYLQIELFVRTNGDELPAVCLVLG